MRKRGEISRRERVCRGLVMIAAFLLVNAALFVLHYREYRQKLDLVYQAVTAEEAGVSTLSWAVNLLKNGISQKTSDRTPELLLDYGYGRTYRNALQRVFVQNCLLSLAATAALLVTGLLLLYWQRRTFLHLRQLEQKELAAELALLRRGDYAQRGRLLDPDELGLQSLAEQMRLITERAAREKEETKTLVTDISHQLKTPLAALSAGLDILKREGLTPEEQREFVGRCSEQLVRLNELASSLLQISRMETGMIQITLARAPVFDTILQAVNRIYPKAEEKQIEIVLKDGARQTELLQDVRWLSEAFINILENAVKYSEPGKTVTIRSERLQTFLRLEFEDCGIGIPKEERNRIFQRFYRGEDERVRQENGSGVGLYLARKIIEKHYGTIRVKDAPGGRGSVFVVQIPYA